MKRLAMVQHTGPNSPVGRAHGEHRRWRRRLSTAAAPFLLALLALAQALACGPRPADGFRGNSSERPYVIMVSFDGFRHDYLDRFELPNFRRVAQAGTRADALIPVFPAKTFPNHYSIATGLYPERHGLVGNEFYDPGLGATYRMRDRSAVQDGRWYGGEPIWVTAEKQGVVSAAYFWVGTEAPIQGVRPTYYRLYNARVPNEARVDTALAWLRLPPERRPHLLL
ncbi:MAG: alkaline phosphatase family protein, partial [Gemmatimonadetes bacterium]|nr:alkaline phosphatase family protein [Gemmatimonadota bacterium]